MKTSNINKPVSVTRLSFGRDMRAYPQAIEFDGKTYEFIDRGLSCTVKRGEQSTHILTLSDGERQFWLRDGGRGAWTLMSMSA